MQEGDIGLAALPQQDDLQKLRPILIFKSLNRFDDLIVCAITSQLRHEDKGLDEIVIPDTNNNLKQISLIRLTSLHTIPQQFIQGKVGVVSTDLHQKLLKRLSAFLIANIEKPDDIKSF